MRENSRLILVGQVAGGFGVKGEVRVTAFTADPLALTDYGPLLRADGSVGLTLTQADTTIWYAPIFSLEIFEQANNRMNRPGQRNPMTVAMIEGTAIESAIYAALKGKGRMQDSVLDLYKKELGLT